MNDAQPAREPVPPPPSSADVNEVLRKASGGRLALRLLLGAVALGAAGGGAWAAHRWWQVRSVRIAPMASLPGRTVRIGNDARGRDEGLSTGPEERPAHGVAIVAFRIDLRETTVAAFRTCLDAGACTAPATGTHCNWAKADRDEHPVNCVSYTQAEAFCRWVDKRLPTEVEWEYAAGGAEPKRLFPWGDTLPLAESGNVCGVECTAGARPPSDLAAGEICGRDGTCRPRLFDFDDRFPETAPVGSFPRGSTAEGIADLAGNVWEWTSSPPCTYPTHDCADGGERVIRGGGWTHRYLMSPEVTTREKLAMTAVSDGVGFRCAR